MKEITDLRQLTVGNMVLMGEAHGETPCGWQGLLPCVVTSTQDLPRIELRPVRGATSAPFVISQDAPPRGPLWTHDVAMGEVRHVKLFRVTQTQAFTMEEQMQEITDLRQLSSGNTVLTLQYTNDEWWPVVCRVACVAAPGTTLVPLHAHHGEADTWTVRHHDTRGAGMFVSDMGTGSQSWIKIWLLTHGETVPPPLHQLRTLICAFEDALAEIDNPE